MLLLPSNKFFIVTTSASQKLQDERNSLSVFQFTKETTLYITILIHLGITAKSLIELL